jgi:hypothetical protein
MEISPSRIRIEFSDGELLDDGLHAKKFSHVRRLIEPHWLDGFPLWGYLTGLSDRPDCKGPFGDYMYFVRQIMALYRIDPQTWKQHSTEYLRRCHQLVDDKSSANGYETPSDDRMVELIIDLLCGASEIHLEYGDNYVRVGRNGSQLGASDFEVFRYKGKYRKTAYVMAHAFVHIVCQYRDKVDRKLRQRLGGECEKWEKLPDDEAIPDGVVL